MNSKEASGKACGMWLKRVTTHYQTLQTWANLNVTRYHSLNALPHALPHALPYIFCEIFFRAICNALRSFF